MSHVMVPERAEARAAVSALFETSPPVLVEVHFPACGTSSDWYLCESEEQFDRILDGLVAGTELHVNSVWDLKNVKGPVCLRK